MLGGTMVPTWSAGGSVSLPDPGYQLGPLIGRGGMGEVLVGQDQRIGREVAIKRIRSPEPSADAVIRFLREARIQARLDHPAIVPVYELGIDADGRPYFTMKRLTGETLESKVLSDATIHRLLRAFVDVCLAIQFAHARGVVHRDLKPSNIMLGDYGEVYVLDWGVARVITDRQRRTYPKLGDEVDEQTTAGAILGTPGYMAPEQIEGHEVGPPADVYALGAILFEILAGEPLHPRGEPALASTLSKPQQALARRAADRVIPPELDAVCFDALALDPRERPTARELADRVQAYLDGDRDTERRRALAADYLSAARTALESAAWDGRATAVRHAGRALALDPTSAEAAALVTSLILEPPAELPPALVASLEAEAGQFHRSRNRVAMWTYAGLLACWALVPFLKVKNWTELLAFTGLLMLGLFQSARVAATPTGRSPLPITLTIVTGVVVGFSRIAGPFILTPIVVCSILMSISAIPKLHTWRLAVWALVATLLPFVLEWTGLVQQTYKVVGGALVTTSEIFDFRDGFDGAFLVGADVAFVIAACVVAIAITRKRVSIQRELHVRAWHLRHLLPKDMKTRKG